MNVPLPPNEPQRLNALRGYTILDTPAEEAFERMTRTAAALFDVPVALVTFIDEDRQWLKSCYGVDLRQIDREIAFCSYAILENQLMVVPDATRDERFQSNPLVTGEHHVRFYAGAPLTSPDGFNLGTLCILDTKPRDLSAAQRALLVDLAATVLDALELRRVATQMRVEISERRQVEETLRLSEANFRSLVENASDVTTVLDFDGTIRYESPSVRHVLGYRPEELVGKVAFDFIHPDDRAQVLQAFGQLTKSSASQARAEFRWKHKDGSWCNLESVGTYKAEDAGLAGVIVNSRDVTERRRVEEELRHSEARKSAIVETALDCIVTIDHHGRIIEWNPAAERTFGYSREAAIGQMLAELLIPPALRDAHHAGFLKYQQTGEGPILGRRIEVPALHADGTERLIELAVNSIPGEEHPMFTAYLRDITATRQAAEELRRSEERFRSVIEGVKDYAIVMLDVNGSIASWGSGAEKMTGYTAEEVIGKENRYFYSHEDIAAGRPGQELQLVAEQGRGEEEGWRIRKDGSRFWVNAVTTALYNESGQLWGFAKIARDITESKQIEERLRLLESVAVHANDAILITEAEPIDLPGPRIVYANEAFLRSTGYSAEEILGQTPRLLQGPGTSPEAKQKIRSALESWQPVVVEVLNYRKDGTPFWVELSIVPIANALGWFTHWVSVQRDITERKLYNEALRQAKEESERANQAKSEFLSRMSHELRTPLNGILGFSQVLQMDFEDGVYREMADDIYDAGRHLLGLINEVLDISRIEAGHLTLAIEPVPIHDAITQVIDLLKATAAQRGIRIINEDHRRRHVMADPQRLTQCLINMVSNAIKYNREGGQVTVSFKAGIGNRLRLSVTDTGIGIPEDKIERLFTPFDRLDVESTNIEGSGLGLSITKRLVEGMNGTIEVESRIGVGSTFSIELPLDTSYLENRQQPTTEEPVAKQAAHTLLYIEDNVQNIRVVEHILARRTEFTLLTALHGSAGLELAALHHPELILLDLHLPDMSGIQVLQRLQENPDTKNIPVIVLSADATHSQRKHLLSMGARDYLTKPIEVKLLLAALDATLSEKPNVPA